MSNKALTKDELRVHLMQLADEVNQKMKGDTTMNNEKILDIADKYDSGDKYGPAATWNFITEDLIVFARDMQKAERERIKSRVKEAAESLWCIRNEVVEEVDEELKRVPYSLYIGPSLNTMEEFVNRLLEET